MRCSLQLLHVSFPVFRPAVIPLTFEYTCVIESESKGLSFTSLNTLGQSAVSLERLGKVIQEL